MIVNQEKLDDMIVNLLDMDLVKNNDGIVFSDEAKELIHNIAEKCKEISLVNQANDKAEEYAESLSPEDIYIDMLHKIVKAPTRLHMKKAYPFWNSLSYKEKEIVNSIAMQLHISCESVAKIFLLHGSADKKKTIEYIYKQYGLVVR